MRANQSLLGPISQFSDSIQARLPDVGVYLSIFIFLPTGIDERQTSSQDLFAQQDVITRSHDLRIPFQLIIGSCNTIGSLPTLSAFYGGKDLASRLGVVKPGSKLLEHFHHQKALANAPVRVLASTSSDTHFL
jgi:hypothetical protein